MKFALQQKKEEPETIGNDDSLSEDENDDSLSEDENETEFIPLTFYEMRQQLGWHAEIICYIKICSILVGILVTLFTDSVGSFHFA